MAWYDYLYNSNGLTNAGTSLLGAGINALGTAYAANQASGAQQDVANQQIAAGQQAAEMAAFRPVGVTTRFGSSGFQYDPQGRLVGAGYQVAPDVAAQRESLMGLAGGSLSQAQAAQGLMPQYNTAAQGLFNLGQQFLPTSTQYSASPEAMQYANLLNRQSSMAMPTSYSNAPTAASQQYSNQLAGIAGAALPSSFEANATPEAQALYSQLTGMAGRVMPTSYDTTAAAQDYMRKQQALLAPGREQELAKIRNQLQQTGRAGLATGATETGGLAATNPEMAAYYNAMAQQDAQLGANAEQIARGNLQQDISLASQLGTTGLSNLTASQQNAVQNALSRGQFGTGLIGAGYGATTAAGQQNLANALSLGQYASGLSGQALQTQQAADEIARQRMLSNLSVGQGLFGASAGLMGQGYGLQSQALSPWQSYLGGAQTLEGLGQQALTTGAGLGSSAAQAGAQAGANLLKGNIYGAENATAAAKLQSAGIQGAIQGFNDPISKLIGNLGQPAWQGTSLAQTFYGNRGIAD